MYFPSSLSTYMSLDSWVFYMLPNARKLFLVFGPVNTYVLLSADLLYVIGQSSISKC